MGIVTFLCFISKEPSPDKKTTGSTTMKRIFLNFILVPKLGTSKMTDGNFMDFVSSIILSVKDNANFTNEQTAIGALKLKLADFIATKGKIKYGPSGAAAAKDAIRAEMEQMLKALAIACADEVNNDLAKFLTSGFSIREHHAITGLKVPTAVKLSVGASDTQLELSFKGDEKASYYKIWIGLDTESLLNMVTTTASKLTVTGCKPGVRYYVRLAACGKKDVMSAWSSFVSRIAA